jgi:hypothetical protein
VVLVACVLPATAFGQATRTWVSGVGDDVNPCSRTAPCKTFAGAISKTATGGIINAMDDGGFGAVTITKAITIDGGYHTAGVLASGGINAINVNAPAGSRVVLRRLDIEGNGTTLGLNGVNIISAQSVRIEQSLIHDFSRSGILMADAIPSSTLVVSDTTIAGNGGNGVTVAPGNAGNPNRAKILRSLIQENACGVVAASFGMSNVFATDCGTSSSASGISSAAPITTFDSSITFNTGTGIFSRGVGGIQRIGRNEISGNAFGLRVLDAGAQIISLTGNSVAGNGTDGAPTSTVPPV